MKTVSLLLLCAFSACGVVLEWDRNPEPNVLGYGVFIGTNSRSYVTNFTTTNISVTITNSALFKGTNFFAVTAFDDYGLESDYSDEVFIASPDVTVAPDLTPPAAVSNLLVINVSTNSATLSWTAPGDDGNVGTGTSYDLRFSTSLITTSNWSSATQLSNEPAPMLAGTTQSFTVTKLSAGLTYYFALKTTDESSNVSPLSNIATGMTAFASAGGTPSAFLIPSNSVWKYLDNGSDQGTAWIDPAFNDSAWASGPTQLGYNGGREATIVSYGGNSSAKHITTYFRHHFLVNNPAAFTNLYFAVQRDDGVVVYLNGIEVFRDNMPMGGFDYRTIAPISVSGTDKTSFHPGAPLPAAYLFTGDNVVAAEVHQHSSSSTSMDFNLELKAILAAPIMHIALGPSDLTADAVAYNRINLTWKDNADNEQGFKLERSTNGTDFLQLAILGANKTNFTDTTVLENTTYDYRLFAFNILSNSDYSIVAQATTPVAPDLTPPAAVSNLLVINVSTNSATLSWTAPGDDGNVGTGTSYDLRFSTSNITTSNWSSATQVIGEPAPEPAGTPQSFAINGLIAGRTYYFALKTSDETNNVSRLSNVASAGTPLPGPDTNAPSAIADLAVVAVTSSNATLSWTAPGDDGSVGTAKSYDVRYSASPIIASNWSSASQATGEPAPAPAGTAQLFMVQNLTAGRTYYFAIRTSDETNNVSPLSNVASATTAAPPPPDGTPPAAVTNLAVVNVTSNTALLSWTTPEDDGNAGNATTYDLRFSTSLITTSNWSSATQLSNEPAPMLAGTTQSFTVTKLSAGLTYYFALKTTDESSNVSPLSNIATGMTAFASAGGTPSAFLIPSNSVWKYLDNGSDQGTAWIDPAFNDSAWASGPTQLGYNGGREATIVSYGGNSSAKHITTYFRHHFLVNNPAAFTNLYFAVQRDDGVVVYLNGIEVFRDNMPMGGFDYRTIAPISVSGTDKTSFHPGAPLPAAYLFTGDNVVAAEVHQHSSSSTSMDFNLELKAILAAPIMHIALGPSGEATLRWNSYPGKRYRLQYVTDIGSTNWTALGDDIIAADFTVSVIETRTETRYYRVLLLD